MVGFLASALRAPAPKPTKCDTIPSAYLFSRKWFTSIDITDFFPAPHAVFLAFWMEIWYDILNIYGREKAGRWR